MDWNHKLGGGDLRSIGKANEVAKEVKSQECFDSLFLCLYKEDRLTVMRAADAIEKITKAHPEYLASHKEALLRFCRCETPKEFKWHLALLLPRLPLTVQEALPVFEILKKWALAPNESKIVRANALESLYLLSKETNALQADFSAIVQRVEKEKIPSLEARLRKLNG